MRTILRYAALALMLFVFIAMMFVAGFLVQHSTLTAPAAQAATSTSAAPSPTASTVGDPTQADFGVFWEVWGLLNAEFSGKLPDNKQMTYAAIQGVVDSLGDSHTTFTDPQRAAILESDLSGSFEGIGATVEQRTGQIVIVAPIKGSPAEKAGVMAGDIVTKIDGQTTDGLSLMDAISRIRGPKGTQVTLTVVRAGAPVPVELTITRDSISVKSVTTRQLDNGLVYIQLSEFTGTASKEMDDALKTALASNPKGIVLDLRGNPGGYLQTAIEIASEFISNGVIVSERDKNGKTTDHRALPGGRAAKVPLVVLVDKGSASAAEILSGAIKDTKRGVLVGDTTYGKGSVQVSNRLSDDSRLTVTIRHWLTPSGHDIDGQGIEPDFAVPFPESDRKGGRDPQLDRAVKYLLTGS
jgi:carboxyl-terminal processing protease